jgi:cation diffusion facilitator CzcD-associated flavoprotein CzcO/acetyl esterase/lipase
MASWQARLAAFFVRHRIKPALGDMRDIARVRAVFETRLPVPRGARFTAATLGGIPGEWVEPADPIAAGAARHLTVLYLHGGGFIGCAPRTHRPLTAALALQGARLFVPDYRLAPEHPFPAAIDDVCAAWRALRDGAAADASLTVAGDSAGGTLALALMLVLRAAGERLPDAAALFSPGTDLTGSSPSLDANAARDAMFERAAVEQVVATYLNGADPRQPLASPLLADLHGLPPLLVHVGADELLRDDSVRLAEKARAAGVAVELKVWPVVPHVWQMLVHLPEARRSVAAAVRFLREASAADDGAAEDDGSEATGDATVGPPAAASTAQAGAAARPVTAAPTPAARAAPSSAAAGTAAETEHDVIIVGAGLSGIGAAAHLQDRCPRQRVAIFEARDAIGGTWDLFRYPGIRSDSDMYTLGYEFKPWADAKAIADGSTIRRYIVETAAERGIDRRIRFGHRVVAADWSSADARWTVEVEHDGRRERHSCRFLLFCSGYYRYDTAYRPSFAGEADFRGQIVHPQFWPADLDYAGRRIVVIGSGATAVTLVPELAKTAAHVTMLQRSPSYIVALPSKDRIAEALKRRLPAAWAYRLVRLKNVLVTMLFFNLARRWPEKMKARLIGEAARRLGAGHDVATHFTPRYDPWDQRLCVAADADLFRAIRQGRASVVTDAIERFTEHGIRLASGTEIDADLVVTATGLTLNLLGDATIRIDGERCDPSTAMTYKGMMFSDVPNLASTFGYTNASWTLKADLTARFVCRLLTHMERHGHAVAIAHRDPTVEARPFIDFSSGYVQRASQTLPKQGARRPWRLYQNYLLDLMTLRFGRIDDGTLTFGRATAPPPAPTASARRDTAAVE